MLEAIDMALEEAKDQMEKIETNLSKKFEDVGFKFNAGLND